MDQEVKRTRSCQAVEFLQPTFTALSKRFSSEQVGRVTPFCSCNQSSISRLAKSLKSPLSLVTRKGRSLDKTPIVLVSLLIRYLLSYSTYQATEGILCFSRVTRWSDSLARSCSPNYPQDTRLSNLFRRSILVTADLHCYSTLYFADCCQTSNIRHPTSDMEHQTWNIRHRTSDK